MSILWIFLVQVSLFASAAPAQVRLGVRILHDCARPDHEGPSAAAEADEIAEARCSLNMIKNEFGGQTRFSEINSSEKHRAVIEELGKLARLEAARPTNATESIQMILDLERGLQNPLPSWQKKTLDRYGIEKMAEIRERYLQKF